jgi:hypothetical protein
VFQQPCCDPIYDICSVVTITIPGGTEAGAIDACDSNNTGWTYDGTYCTGLVFGILYPIRPGLFRTFGYATSYFHDTTFGAGAYRIDFSNPLGNQFVNYWCSFASHGPAYTGSAAGSGSTSLFEANFITPNALFTQTSCIIAQPGTANSWTAAGVSIRI